MNAAAAPAVIRLQIRLTYAAGIYIAIPIDSPATLANGLIGLHGRGVASPEQAINALLGRATPPRRMCTMNAMGSGPNLAGTYNLDAEIL